MTLLNFVKLFLLPQWCNIGLFRRSFGSIGTAGHTGIRLACGEMHCCVWYNRGWVEFDKVSNVNLKIYNNHSPFIESKIIK